MNHPTPPAAASDFVSIPRASLKWWRELVDINPADLAPRIDAYLTAPPIAQQGGVEELWKFVERAYDAAKTSRSERLLDDLGLPVSDVEMPLSWHINRAALASKADGETA